MASADENTIEIIFKAVDEFTETLDDVSGKIADFGAGIQDIADPFASAAEQVLVLDAAINIAVVAGLSAASAKAGDFKQAMNEINTIGKFTPEIFADLQKKSLDAFDSIRSTDMEGYMRALNQTVAFGVTEIPQIFEAIKIGEQLSIAGTAKLDETIVGLLGTMNAYGATQAETAKYADIFFQITQDGNASVAELSAYLSQVTSSAAGAKIPFETIGAAIAALTAQGVPASQAITAINAAIGGIINPTADAKGLMNELGIQYGATGLQAIGFEGVLKQIYEKTGGNIDVITKLITTVEGQKAALLLGADSAGKFAGSLENMKNVSGAAAEGVKRSTNEMEQTLQLLVNAWDKMQTEIGQKIPSFNANVIGPFTEIFKNIGKSVDAGSLDEVFEIINKFGEKLKTYLTGIANAVPEALKNADFSKFIEAYEKLAAAGSSLFEGFDLSTPKGLSDALQLVIDTMTSLNQTSAGVIESFKPLFDTIKAGIEWYNSLSAANKELIGNLGGIAIQVSAAAGFLGTLGGVIGGIGSLFTTLSGGAAAFGTAIAGAGTAVSAFAIPLAAIATIPTGIAYFTSDTAKKKIDETAQGFIGWADSLIDWTDSHDKAGESSDEVTKKLISEAKAMQDARKATEENMTAIDTALADAFDFETIDIEPVKVGLSLEEFQKELDNGLTEYYTVAKEDIENNPLLVRATFDPNEDSEKAKEYIDYLQEGISDLQVKISTESATATLQELNRDVDELVTEKHLTILADEDSVAHAKGYIAEKIGDHTVITNIFPPSPEKAKKTKEELEKIVPPEKQLKIMAEIDIANIEAQTEKFKSIQETIQSKFEWNAKLNIAEVEANTAILEKSMDNINTMFTESSSLISDAFGLLGSLDFGSAGSIDIFRLVKEQIREQNDLQREALGLQKEITESQIRLNEAKQKALLLGKPMFEITVDGSGLQTHLESILYSIMQFAQEKATAEGLESLLGL